MLDWIQNFGGVLVVLAALVTAGVYLFTTGKKGRSDIVRQDNADLRASNQDKDKKISGLEATVLSQTDTIKNLREVATQTPAVTQLIEITTKQQQTVNKQHSDVIKQLSELAKQMSKMTTEFSHIAAAISKQAGKKE